MPKIKDFEYANLIKNSLSIKSLSELEAYDRNFRTVVETEDKDYWPAWFAYNEFRIANMGRLPKNRPHILTSGLYDGVYPNHHIKALFALADVITLQSSSKTLSYHSLLQCQSDTLFSDILKQLPEGFKPSFYWDNQVEHLHYIPVGIEKASFPIIASVCHTFLHKTVQHVCNLFDYIIPISKFHGDLLRRRYGEKIIDLPFGLNWGTFDLLYKPSWEKTIDVLLCFEPTTNPIYANKRNIVIEAVKKFKQKYNERFSILILSNLCKEDYIKILKQSKIAINVSGVHGPYNYRTVETMCTGTLLFQYDWGTDFFENKFSELFIDGVHGISFTIENLESKLLYYLEHKNEMESVSKAGYHYLLENYNYKKLFSMLIEIINNKPSFTYPRKHLVNKGLFQRDMIYLYQGNERSLLSLGSGLKDIFHQTPWIRYNNLMVYASIVKQGNPYHSLLLLQLLDEYSYTHKPNQKELYFNLYQKAELEVPIEFTWIVEWNYFLVSSELNICSKQSILDMLKMLYELEPTPFDEEGVIFKYYFSNPTHPYFNISFSEFHLPLEFMTLNIELMKVTENDQLRVNLYREYAIKLTKYLLESSII